MVEKIDLNNLDKSEWESFRFEDIAKRISESVDPNTTLLEKYVGLEHIDAENIHINKYGTPDDVSGGKLKCYPGDVIFGKRRAYQRKAGVVDFEGICSAHAFVFRANPEVIEPKLFPFFLHSDQFMHRAVDISVGGLSPTINWGDLKGQEFLLPPKAEQARLAELLWAMDEVIEKEKVVLEKMEVNKATILRFYISKKANEIKLRDIGEIVTGSTPPTNEKKYWDGNIQFVTPPDINDDVYVYNTERNITPEGLNKIRKIPRGAVMIVCIASIGKIAISKIECATNQQINSIIPKFDYDSKYIYYTLLYCKNKIIRSAGTSVVPILNKSDFGNITIPIICKKDRDLLVKNVEIIDDGISLVKIQITVSQSLQKSLINQIF